MTTTEPRISVYVDGFNFYYGLFKGPNACPAKYKWLDIVKLSQAICKSQQIAGKVNSVRYCSAPSLPSSQDPNQPARQELLFRALRALPEVEITLGQHIEATKWVKYIGSNNKPNGLPFKAFVREEKGSDVNLAAFLIRDAAKNCFDKALVITNDSDIENAVRIVRDDFSLEVYVASPHFRQKSVTRSLKDASTRAFKINPSLLASCLLPDPSSDEQGKLIFKPKDW